MAIFFVAQFAVSQFLGNKQAASNSSKQGSPPIPAFDDRPHPSSINDYNPVPQSIAPIWAENSTLDLRVYVSPSLSMPALTAVDLSSLVVSEDRFALGDWRENRDIDTSFVIPKEVQNNGTLWAHLYIALSGHILDPKEKGYDTSKAYHFFRPLSQYRAKKKIVKTKNLLSLAEEKGEEVAPPEEGPVTYASYYHPNFTLSFVPTSGVQTYTSMHPAIRQHVQLESSGARDQNGQNGWYYPILYTNTFWQLKDHMTELNDTVQTLPLHIKLNNLANWKFNIYASMDESVKQAQRNAASGTGMTAGGDGSEFEEFKRVLVDTNIYLLSTTAIVSVFHMIFEALAFKSDVSHWRQKKDNVGVSVRTILANVFMQSVIFLYLFDNSEGTSWMILVGQGMGILIEAWKITKTVNVRVRPADAGSLLPYKITFEDKHKLSATEKKTQEYDEIAFKYLYMVAVPLLLGYAVYSLVYDTHKSWYSFVLTTLVGSVYAYGFLMMVPSLYINYRLKVSSSSLILLDLPFLPISPI